MAVFLSYHSSRKETVDHLARYLLRQEIPTWYAPRDIAPGLVWDEAISAAIKSSSALVLLFCGQADNSTHVKREIQLADSAGIPIFWVRIESVEPQHLGYYLNTTQWVDWLDQRDGTLEQLVRSLSSIERSQGPLEVPSTGAAPSAATPTQLMTNDWPRAILALPDAGQAAEYVARQLFVVAQRSPDCSILLPTGRAATAIFRAMRRCWADYGERPFGDAHLINDTETFGVWSGHDTSRTRHVHHTLIEPLRQAGALVPADNVHLLSGLVTEVDPLREAQRALRAWPPAAHAISLAPTGEVLAYEVGTYLEPDDVVSDGPRVIELSEHGRGYIDPSQPSRSVITTGMGATMNAQLALLLAFDDSKGNILRQVVTTAENAGVPATLLRRHRNVFIVTTQRIVRETSLDMVAVVCNVDQALKHVEEFA